MTKFYSITALVFILLGLIAYANILDAFFLSDDFELVNLVRTGGPFGVWTHAVSGFFRPLISLSLFLDYRFYGLNPFGFHLTNVVLHALNAVLVSIVATLTYPLYQKRVASRIIAIFVGLAFLVFPSHTEAVSWISGRTDVIATFFCLVSLVAYLVYDRHGRFFYLGLSLLAFLGALLSKESVITFPFVLIGYVLSKQLLGSEMRSELCKARWILSHFFVLGIYFLARYISIGSFIGGYGHQVHLNFDVLHLLRSLNFFLLRAVLPAMSTEVWDVIFDVQKIVLIPLIGIGVGSILIAKKARLSVDNLKSSLFFLFAFLVSLVPVLNLGISGNVMRERLLYWPSVFSTLWIVYVVACFVGARKAWSIVMIITLSFGQILLYHSNENWRKAAKITESIVHDLSSIKTDDPLIILNLPDNYRGAYILRNGIEHVLPLFYDLTDLDVVVISYHDVHDPSDRVSCVQIAPNLYQVELLNPAAQFTPTGPTIHHAYFTVRDLGPGGYNLSLTGDEPQTLLMYSASQLVVVPR